MKKGTYVIITKWLSHEDRSWCNEVMRVRDVISGYTFLEQYILPTNKWTPISRGFRPGVDVEMEVVEKMPDYSADSTQKGE